jgi:acyl-CoA synthetase (AMP-forming)/AMP-acid ligase II
MFASGNKMNISTSQMIFDRLRKNGSKIVLWEKGRKISANQILERVNIIKECLISCNIGIGSTVGFKGDYSLDTISTFLALFEIKAIAVPFSNESSHEMPKLSDVIGLEFWFDVVRQQIQILSKDKIANHSLVHKLRKISHPGLIIFTSGSSGKPKAILHDVDRVASKFVAHRNGWRTILFLSMDHFGGFNTLLASLIYEGEGVCVQSRLPIDVCKAIELSGAELLPTTPTFLSILLASNVWRQFDLSTIKLVTYGAEPMPESLLKKLPDVFPNAKFKQTYGLSEVGVLHSVSPDEGSLWLRVGGQGFETKVVNQLLYIKSSSSMLGYLNATNPIDDDGWMNTGDVVEEKDGLIKIVGRQSDVINVGGQKVFPTEVEEVLLELSQVSEASVFSIKHPVLGQVVGARLSLIAGVDEDECLQKVREYCKNRLQKYKIPMRFQVVEIAEHSSYRGKKIRL